MRFPNSGTKNAPVAFVVREMCAPVLSVRAMCAAATASPGSNSPFPLTSRYTVPRTASEALTSRMSTVWLPSRVRDENEAAAALKASRSYVPTGRNAR